MDISEIYGGDVMPMGSSTPPGLCNILERKRSKVMHLRAKTAEILPYPQSSPMLRQKSVDESLNILQHFGDSRVFTTYL